MQQHTEHRAHVVQNNKSVSRVELSSIDRHQRLEPATPWQKYVPLRRQPKHHTTHQHNTKRKVPLFSGPSHSHRSAYISIVCLCVVCAQPLTPFPSPRNALFRREGTVVNALGKEGGAYGEIMNEEGNGQRNTNRTTHHTHLCRAYLRSPNKKHTKQNKRNTFTKRRAAPRRRDHFLRQTRPCEGSSGGFHGYSSIVFCGM